MAGGAPLSCGCARAAPPKLPAAHPPDPLPGEFHARTLRLRGLVRTTASVVAAASLLAALPLAAQEPPQQERVHVVRPGETLWDIARAYLNDPFLWPEIFRLNADVVEDPARIYPAERLVLPGGGPVAEGEFAMDEGPADDGPRVRFAERTQRPAVLEGDFYRAAFVAPAREVPLVGRFMEPEFQSVVQNRMPMQINLYDRVYVRVDPSAVQVGDRLHFLREGRAIDRRRRVYEPSGVGTVAALDGETATVVVVGMYGQVQPGHVVIPEQDFPLRTLDQPAPVSADLQGRILAFSEARPLQRTEDILFLDVGRNAGVAVGDVFEAYDPPTRRRWGTRPELPVARMQVVRVTEGTASVRVTELEQPRIAVGQPVRRVARMP